MRLNTVESFVFLCRSYRQVQDEPWERTQVSGILPFSNEGILYGGAPVHPRADSQFSCVKSACVNSALPFHRKGRNSFRLLVLRPGIALAVSGSWR
jgi:hypothetical protein